MTGITHILKYLVPAAIVVVGIAGWLSLRSLEPLIPEYTVSGLRNPGVPRGTDLRVRGEIVPGSISEVADTEIRFSLREGGEAMNVVYGAGAGLPDTFGDCAEALVTGRYEDGVFRATGVQAKAAMDFSCL